MNVTYSLLLVVTFFISAACEINLEKLMEIPSADSEIRNVENLSSNQFKIAKRICMVFEEKESDFRNHLNKNFGFKLTSLKCGREEYRDRRVTLVLSEDEFDGELSFRSVGYHGRYLEDVQTSTKGVLSHFCPDILAGDAPTNTVELMGGIEKLQVVFIHEKNRDVFQANYYKLNGDGNYAFKLVDEFWVNTGNTNGDLLRGIVYHRVQRIPCSKNYSPEATQTFHQVLEY